MMSCEKCGLHETCFVNRQMGQGKKGAKIMFVADTVSEDENMDGSMMIGKHGKLFRELLLQLGINPDEDCYFAAVTKCPTPSDDKGVQRQPSREEIAACKSYLEAEIKVVNPDIIVPMGNVALSVILGRTGITKERGKAVKKDERIIFPMVHPSVIFRQPVHAKNFTTDIKTLGSLVKDGESFLEKKEVDYRYLETASEIENELELMRQRCTGTDRVVIFDLESTGLNPFLKESKIVCIALTDETHKGIVIPLKKKDFVWASEEEYNRTVKAVKEFLEDETIIKGGHNGQFDIKWLKYKYDITVANYKEDPMIAHYLTVSEERGGHGLKQLAWEHTDMGGYDNALDDYKKEHGIVGNYDDIPWEILREYAAADVDCTLRLVHVFQPLVKSKEKWPELYEMYIEGAQALGDMELNGLHAEKDRIVEFQKAYAEKIEELEEKLREFPEIVQIEREKQKLFELRQMEMKKPKEERDPVILKYNKFKNFKFSFGSPAQLRELLFEKLGLDTPFLTDKGKLKPKSQVTIQDYSTGKETLAYLADRHPIAKMMAEWRKLEKLNGTYIAPALNMIGEDGLVHPSFLITGCLSPDSLILTNKGEIPIGELADYDLTKEGEFFDLLDPELEVFDGEIFRKPLKAFYNGFKEVVTIRLLNSNEKITCTLNHRLGSPTGWVFAGDIKEGDTLLTFDENNNPVPDLVVKVEYGECETFDLTMDEYDFEQFKSMRFVFNDGSEL